MLNLGEILSTTKKVEIYVRMLHTNSDTAAVGLFKPSRKPVKYADKNSIC